jgi:hypothetical protein
MVSREWTKTAGTVAAFAASAAIGYYLRPKKDEE